MFDATRVTRSSPFALAIGVASGATVRGVLPPFVLDDPFWRSFWSGPPAAGIFALLGAGLAFAAGRVAARTARHSSERQEWWDRAEWAMNLARSDNVSDRFVGLRTLAALKDEATEMELQMIVAVTEAVVGNTDVMDKAGAAQDNG